MQYIITAGLFCFVVSAILAVKLCFSRDSRKAACIWGGTALVCLILIAVYFSPASFKWNATASETNIRILGDAPAFSIESPEKREELISALSAMSFQRPLFNGEAESYDPKTETRFLILIQKGQDRKEIMVSVAPYRGQIEHINFIETDSGLKANDPNQFLDVLNSIL